MYTCQRLPLGTSQCSTEVIWCAFYTLGCRTYHSSILACLCGMGFTMTPFLGDRVIVLRSSRGSCPGFSSNVYC